MDNPKKGGATGAGLSWRVVVASLILIFMIVFLLFLISINFDGIRDVLIMILCVGVVIYFYWSEKKENSRRVQENAKFYEWQVLFNYIVMPVLITCDHYQVDTYAIDIANVYDADFSLTGVNQYHFRIPLKFGITHLDEMSRTTIRNRIVKRLSLQLQCKCSEIVKKYQVEVTETFLTIKILPI